AYMAVVEATPQLFALHEGWRSIADEAMKQVSADEVVDALTQQPFSAYVRRIAFIWQKANGEELRLPWEPAGNYTQMFDPEDYFTGNSWEREPRLRVDFNGIGPYEYCPVVRRDDALQANGTEVLQRLKQWADDPLNAEILDRVMSWAYLSETRDSYAIENETPSPTKEQTFLQAMKHLQDRTHLTEEYLVGLQNVVISDPSRAEQEFRSHQNWLQRGGHGSLAVRYVPPPPEALESLMGGFMRMANAHDDVPPLIKAALVSFGFVFLHPFIDGNGRLSRLLAHHSLNFQNVLPDLNGSPALLPLSVAMKKNEREYLAALESFSKPARALWEVIYIADNDFVFNFKSSPMAYAHWDGQAAAQFITACAESALLQSLIDEAVFIHAYDTVFEKIDRTYDLPNRTINLLIQWIRQNGCKMPERRRTAQELVGLRPDVVNGVEAIVSQCFGTPGAETPPSP
ncbi:MAG: Fic family protein, partial [Alcaligenaceae bacterium]